MSDATNTAQREPELEARPLGDGWVEVRIVYESTAGSDSHPHHARGQEAIRDIGTFVLTFAADVAHGVGAPYLAAAIRQLWKHMQNQCGCDGRPPHSH